MSFASVNSKARSPLTRACKSVFLRLTVSGLSFVEEGWCGNSLSTTTKGLFQFIGGFTPQKIVGSGLARLFTHALGNGGYGSPLTLSGHNRQPLLQWLSDSGGLALLW
ncbi:MAG: hypothetical protein ACREMA_12560, partial [Longimicrobiales bacterium]